MPGKTPLESLQGHFLIATLQMPDPRFAGTVVYLCVHNREGALGLVINQPVKDIDLADIFRHADIPLPAAPLPPVYLGGPVETSSAFFLYSADYQLGNHIAVSPTVALTRDPQLLYDLAAGRGPSFFLPALGYAGWGGGQLENELSGDGWLILPADDEIIFRTPDDQKWKRAARAHGIDITLFGDVVGSA